MPQLFRPRADILFRSALAAAAVVLSGVVLLAAGVPDPAVFRRAGPAPAQPVAFSHARHVGTLGLDCRHCHSSVATAPDAGFPPMWTCMTCHLAIDPPAEMPFVLIWQRVQALPSHTYFHHGAHVAAGVGCATCHGDVSAMEQTRPVRDFGMGWCLDCHRDPAPHLRPPEAVFDPDWRSPPDRPGDGPALLAARGIEPALLDHCHVCHR